MTGKSIVNAVRLNPNDFPNFSKTVVNLYDGKDRINEHESVKYVENIFAKNEKESKRFANWLNSLEKSPVSPIDILIDETHVIVFYKTSHSKVFSRIPSSMDDLDFMA